MVDETKPKIMIHESSLGEEIFLQDGWMFSWDSSGELQVFEPSVVAKIRKVLNENISDL